MELQTLRTVMWYILCFRRALVISTFFFVASSFMGFVVDNILPKNPEEWTEVKFLERVRAKRMDVNGQLQLPCRVSGDCEVQNYVRDGRYARPGVLGSSRVSWSIPRRWKKSGDVSYPIGCYRQVHIWGNENRTLGDFACEGLPCGIRLVQDTSFETMRKSHAMLLLHRTHWDWDDLFDNRPPNQKWIFYSHESRLNTCFGIIPPLERYAETYDYIMSYKIDESHLYGSYGMFDRSKPTVHRRDHRNWAAGRTEKAVWLSSNCLVTGVHWSRYTFVNILSKYFPVNVYGDCGDPYVCPREHNADLCVHELRKHKFYLALENSPCRHYITEKFWSNAYLNDLVPVVFGPPREDYEAVAPPNSFIHVEDFDSIEKLAIYLHKLDNNDHLYNRYFEWKKLGFVVSTKEDWLLEPRQMCQVVDRLLVDEEAVSHGTFNHTPSPNWKTWWLDSCPTRNLPIDVF